MADLFTAHGVLLVRESERGSSDRMDRCLVIQRSVRGGDLSAGDDEGDVLEAEGFRSAFPGGFQVLGGSEGPEEANDRQEDGLLVGTSMGGVVGVQDGGKVADDGQVGWVGASCGVILVSEGLEERSE